MLVDENNLRLELGRQMGSPGGEGCVFEVVGRPGIVAKRYHSPPSDLKVEKLRAQVQIGDSELQHVAAWPGSLIFDRGIPTGFLMPKVEAKPIHLLYRPIDRRDNFPAATWQHLVSVAQNLAAAFHTLHTRGILMADVNESNVLITPDGQARLIDCDSFQITTRAGATYPCGVGVAFWTPPELHGRSFGSLVRNEQHDAFGLAVLIFHLLFMGKHPFAGVPKTQQLLDDPLTLEECIRQFQFAHTRRSSVSLKAPPYSLSLSSLPDRVANLFEEAFLSKTRPSAATWYRELGALEFQKCQWGHIFFRRLADCPWCSIWNSGGPNFFIAASTFDSSGSSSSEIERILAEIERSPPPRLEDEDIASKFASVQVHVVAIPTMNTLQVPTLSRTTFPLVAQRHRTEFIVGLGLILGAVLMTFAAPAGLLLWIIMLVVGYACVAGGFENPEYAREIECRKKRPAEVKALIEVHLATMRSENETATRHFDQAKRQLCADILSEGADAQAAFCKERDKLKLRIIEILRSYRGISQRREELRKERLERSQKEDFLRRHRVASFRIPHIGPARSSFLSNYGIVTAWDVKSMGWMPKLGQGNGELRAWVKRVEERFRFDPKLPLSDIGAQELQRDVLKLEKSILDDFRSLRQCWNELLQQSSVTRLRQLRSVKLAAHLDILNDMNRAFVHSSLRMDEKLKNLLSELGEANAKATVCAS